MRFPQGIIEVKHEHTVHLVHKYEMKLEAAEKEIVHLKNSLKDGARSLGGVILTAG